MKTSHRFYSAKSALLAAFAYAKQETERLDIAIEENERLSKLRKSK